MSTNNFLLVVLYGLRECEWKEGMTQNIKSSCLHPGTSVLSIENTKNCKTSQLEPFLLFCKMDNDSEGNWR